MRRISQLLALLVLAGFTWLGSNSDKLSSSYTLKGNSTEYYPLLVHGFMKGHLYMDAPVDPRFLSSDPEVHSKGAYLLDASLYKGHYYLYFGVVPAVFIYLPYRLLTGSDLSGNAVTLLSVGLGFLFYLKLFSEAKRRYFPNISAIQEIAAVIFLALGPGTPALVVVGGIYETAIAAGYLFHSLTWLFLFKAWNSRDRTAGWLGMGSLLAGLTVGCRPHYVLMLPVVALLAIMLTRRGNNGRVMAIAAVVPALLVGVLLAAYNALRFDTPFEFGIHYAVDDMIGSGYPLYSFSFFWSNLKWYYLRPPALGIYFPYVFPMNATNRPPHYYGFEAIEGQLAVSLLAALTVVSLVAARRRVSELRSFVGLPAFAFGLIYLGLAFLGARSDRYIVDFQASLVLLIVLAAGVCWPNETPGKGLRLSLAGFCLLACVAGLGNLFASFQLAGRIENLRPKTWAAMTGVGNLPSAFLARMGLISFGPVRVHFTLPPFDGKPYSRPLIATGLPNKTDTVYVTQYKGDRVEIAVSHSGYGSVRSASIALDPKKDHVLEADLGSLYPPRGHPWFGGRSAEEVEALKTTATVRLDGDVIIHARLRFYDAPPGWVSFGRNPGGNDETFGGVVSGVERLPPPSTDSFADRAAETGVWSISLVFPFHRPGVGQPILGSGISNHGNLLFVETHRDHTVRFAIDEWGIALLSSPDIPVAGDGPHKLGIFVGGQVARAGLPASWKLDSEALAAASKVVRIWLDDRPVWSTDITVNQDTYNFVSLGSNPQCFSSTQSGYEGAFRLLKCSPEETLAFIQRNLPEEPRGKGALRYRAVFPPIETGGTGIPLLGMGVTGHGNMVFLRPTGSSKAQLAMDDWAHGIAADAPFDVSPAEHNLVFVMGPLLDADPLTRRELSPELREKLRSRILVFVDKRLAGDFPISHQLEHANEVTPGRNPQGFSTAQAKFGGGLFEPEPIVGEELRDLLAAATTPK